MKILHYFSIFYLIEILRSTKYVANESKREFLHIPQTYVPEEHKLFKKKS